MSSGVRGSRWLPKTRVRGATPGKITTPPRLVSQRVVSFRSSLVLLVSGPRPTWEHRTLLRVVTEPVVLRPREARPLTRGRHFADYATLTRRAVACTATPWCGLSDRPPKVTALWGGCATAAGWFSWLLKIVRGAVLLAACGVTALTT